MKLFKKIPLGIVGIIAFVLLYTVTLAYVLFADDLLPFWKQVRGDKATYRVFIPKVGSHSDFKDKYINSVYFEEDGEKSFRDYLVFKLNQNGLTRFQSAQSENKQLYFKGDSFHE